MERMLAGKGKKEDLKPLLDLSAQMTGKTICVLSDSCAAPVVSGIQKFPEEFEAAVSGTGPLLAPVDRRCAFRAPRMRIGLTVSSRAQRGISIPAA